MMTPPWGNGESKIDLQFTIYNLQSFKFGTLCVLNFFTVWASVFGYAYTVARMRTLHSSEIEPNLEPVITGDIR